jgi:uncharacterized protein DUF4339
MQSETEDRWYVEVGGAPKMMTLDELVEAFEASTINSKTLVCEVGGSEWKPLSEVADLGDEEEAPASQQAPAFAAAPAHAPSLPPAPVSQRSVPVGGSSAFPSAVTRPAASAWPPAVNASRPPAQAGSVVPPAFTSSPSVVPPSTMPVVQDLTFGLDDDFKPRKSKAPFVAAAAVLLLVGGALGAAKFTGGGEIVRPVPVPAAAPAPVETVAAAAPAPTTPPAAATTPAPAEEKTASADKPADSSDTRLSDDVKSKLKDADKSRVEKKKAAKASRGHTASRAKSSSSSGVFRAGGNVNDPLNSKL